MAPAAFPPPGRGESALSQPFMTRAINIAGGGISGLSLGLALRGAGVPVRLCGEMGGRPLEAMALIGIGIRNFSITPAAVGPIKAMVRSIDAAVVTTRIEKMLAKPPREMRRLLTDWAKRHSIPLG